MQIFLRTIDEIKTKYAVKQFLDVIDERSVF